jgi:hypothetical protein
MSKTPRRHPSLRAAALGTTALAVVLALPAQAQLSPNAGYNGAPFEAYMAPNPPINPPGTMPLYGIWANPPTYPPAAAPVQPFIVPPLPQIYTPSRCLSVRC